jgi:hypothetical protein
VIDWLHCFGLEAKQNTMAGEGVTQEATYLMVAGKQKETDGQEGTRDKIHPSKARP